MRVAVRLHFAEEPLKPGKPKGSRGSNRRRCGHRHGQGLRPLDPMAQGQDNPPYLIDVSHRGGRNGLLLVFHSPLPKIFIPLAFAPARGTPLHQAQANRPDRSRLLPGPGGHDGFRPPRQKRGGTGTAIGSVGALRFSGGARATRKPRLLFRLAGSFALRFAARQFLASLFQLPPRFTRCEALDRSPLTVVTHSGGSANCTAPRRA